MHKEYFITAPLILSPVDFQIGNCTIRLNGNKDHSYIQGPSAEEVDQAFEFIFAIQDIAHVPGISVFLRGVSKDIAFPKNPREIKAEEWVNWAFSMLPLKSIPLIVLSQEEGDAIQQDMAKLI